MVLSLNEQQRQNCFLHLRSFLEPLTTDAEPFYIQVGGIKTVRVLSCDPEAAPMIRRQLAWSLTEPVPNPDATLVLWREKVDASFHQRVLGIGVEDDGSGDNLILALREGDGIQPFGEVSYENHTANLTDGDCSFYCVESFAAEEWIKEGVGLPNTDTGDGSGMVNVFGPNPPNTSVGTMSMSK